MPAAFTDQQTLLRRYRARQFSEYSGLFTWIVNEWNRYFGATGEVETIATRDSSTTGENDKPVERSAGGAIPTSLFPAPGLEVYGVAERATDAEAAARNTGFRVVSPKQLQTNAPTPGGSNNASATARGRANLAETLQANELDATWFKANVSATGDLSIDQFRAFKLGKVSDNPLSALIDPSAFTTSDAGAWTGTDATDEILAYRNTNATALASVNTIIFATSGSGVIQWQPCIMGTLATSMWLGN